MVKHDFIEYVKTTVFFVFAERLITKLCTGMCCPEEDVQSAIMFIMVYIFEGHWEDHLSPRQLSQLCEDLVCVLNSAKTQILMMNSLGKYQSITHSVHVVQLLQAAVF